MAAKSIYHSPLGPILLEADDKGLTRLVFQQSSKRSGHNGKREDGEPSREENKFLMEAKRQEEKLLMEAKREENKFLTEGKREENKFLMEAKRELSEYFAGERRVFEVPLHVPKGTEFQRRVWRALRTMPYGRTCSYQELAERVASPRAVRAVAQANKANPIAVIVPCHRVIGKSGKLTGYMGAAAEGLALKKALLELEHGARTSEK